MNIASPRYFFLRGFTVLLLLLVFFCTISGALLGTDVLGVPLFGVTRVVFEIGSALRLSADQWLGIVLWAYGAYY